MTPDELLAALSSATDDDAAVREIVRACLRSIRDGTSVEHLELAVILAPLAEHANARVRQEIADGCDLSPEPFYERVVTRLEGDADHFVGAAAARSIKRRASREEGAREGRRRRSRARGGARGDREERRQGRATSRRARDAPRHRAARRARRS